MQQDWFFFTFKCSAMKDNTFEPQSKQTNKSDQMFKCGWFTTKTEVSAFG